MHCEYLWRCFSAKFYFEHRIIDADRTATAITILIFAVSTIHLIRHGPTKQFSRGKPRPVCMQIASVAESRHTGLLVTSDERRAYDPSNEPILNSLIRVAAVEASPMDVHKRWIAARCEE